MEAVSSDRGVKSINWRAEYHALPQTKILLFKLDYAMGEPIRIIVLLLE